MVVYVVQLCNKYVLYEVRRDMQWNIKGPRGGRRRRIREEGAGAESSFECGTILKNLTKVLAKMLTLL